MPTVSFEGETIECERGAVLRDVLLEAGLSPHDGLARTANCGGSAACGTCAVRVVGDVNDVGRAERVRIGVSSHGGTNLRLACRTRVLGDVAVSRPDEMPCDALLGDPVAAGDGER